MDQTHSDQEPLRDILRTYLRAPMAVRGFFIRTLIGRGDETARELMELIGEADFADPEVAQAACWAIYYSTEAGCGHSYGSPMPMSSLFRDCVCIVRAGQWTRTKQTEYGN